MKTYIKILGILLSIGLIGAFVASCDDDVSVENKNDVSLDTFFITLSQIEGAANGCYAQLQSGGLYQRYGYIFPDAMSDEMVAGGDPNFAPFYRFEFTAQSGPIAQYWTSCYNGIGACNFVLDNEGLMRSNIATSDFTKADVDDVIGQALFLRGVYYYLLVKRFGDVPLKIEFSEAELDAPRSSTVEVYNRIIQDFEKATGLLFDKGATEEGRATKGAAYGMLGKVLLHRNEYDKAQTALAKVNGYSLLPIEEYEDNFNESGEFNDESMFEVTFTGEFGTETERWAQNGQGFAEQTFHSQEYTGWGNLKPSVKLDNEFEDDDPRRTVAYVKDDEKYGPNKEFTRSGGIAWLKFSQLYQQESVVENSGINVRFLRYADVVLMQAEVEYSLGNDAAAIGFLNQIRDRAKLPRYGTAEMDSRGFSVSTDEGIFKAIRHERFVELCGEQHRFDDLVRWNRDPEELAIFPDENYNNPDISQRRPRNYDSGVHRLMPIPQNEIDTNNAISSEDQNPGY